MTLPLATFASTPGRKLEIGTFVNFHHRAGVARYKKFHKDLDDVGWKITNGVNPNDTIDPKEAPFIHGYFWNHKRHMFANYPRAKITSFIQSQCNKTVMVWPENGTGWVIGGIRKGIGLSEKGSYSGYEYREYEPGYFVVEMYVDLYVVKTEFNGTQYVLCPTWAISPKSLNIDSLDESRNPAGQEASETDRVTPHVDKPEVARVSVRRLTDG